MWRNKCTATARTGQSHDSTHLITIDVGYTEGPYSISCYAYRLKDECIPKISRNTRRYPRVSPLKLVRGCFFPCLGIPAVRVTKRGS